jgi:hypothetical protein
VELAVVVQFETAQIVDRRQERDEPGGRHDEDGRGFVGAPKRLPASSQTQGLTAASGVIRTTSAEAVCTSFTIDARMLAAGATPRPACDDRKKSDGPRPSASPSSAATLRASTSSL